MMLQKFQKANKEQREALINELNSNEEVSKKLEEELENSDDFFEVYLCEHCMGATELETCRSCGATHMKLIESYFSEKLNLVKFEGKSSYKWVCNRDEFLGGVQ
jgi:recombinational DNA repair protein RecR